MAEEMMGGEELASGAGVKAAIHKRPGGVFLIDEFGDMLSAINNRNAGPHMAHIATTLVKAFTSSEGVWYGTEYADQKLRARVDIPFPCANLYGTTVPSNFYSNLDSSSVAGGFLGRLIILEESSKRPTRRPDRVLEEVPEDIAQWFMAASQIIPSNDPSWASGRPGEYPLPVMYTPAAKRIVQDFEMWCCARGDGYLGTPKESLGELWSRATEHAVKVALAVGVGMTTNPADLLESRHTRCLSIDVEAAQWAVDFVQAVTMHIELAASTRMGDSEHERLAQRVLESVVKAGPKGRTERELAKFCRPYGAAQPSLRDQITSMLTRNGDIKAGQRASASGKSASVWVAS